MTANDTTPVEGQDSIGNERMERLEEDYGVPPTETAQRTVAEAKVETAQKETELIAEQLMGVALRDGVEDIEEVRAELRRAQTDLTALLDLVERRH